MASWKPASKRHVECLLEEGLAVADPVHAAKFERIRVPIRVVEVASDPGETVYIVAVSGSQVLYYSDIEDGWELDELDATGSLPERGSSQFELRHILHQLFGEPASQ